MITEQFSHTAPSKGKHIPLYMQVRNLPKIPKKIAAPVLAPPKRKRKTDMSEEEKDLARRTYNERRRARNAVLKNQMDPEERERKRLLKNERARERRAREKAQEEALKKLYASDAAEFTKRRQNSN